MNATLLRLAGFGGILVVAALRTLANIQPQVLFDVDPARDPIPMLAIGPVGSALLDIALLAAAAVALLGEALAGRGVRPMPVLLAAAGSFGVFLHGLRNSVDAFRLGTWMAAMFAFVALAHLVRERRLRIAALAVLVSLSAPIAVRGVVQVTREHAATVEAYEANRAAFLANRGWEPDSSATRTFERRLRQPEATGWFGFSNPTSSIFGVGLVGLGSIAVFGLRRGMIGTAAAAGAGALLSGALLVANGGKGAIAATALALVVLPAIARARLRPRANLAVWLAGGVLLLVILRGLAGPTVPELSVLLRAFYLDAGARILAAHPFTGVGSDALQTAFMVAKTRICPEDVASLHSIFADWIVSLGVLGAAWAALVALALRGEFEVGERADRHAGATRDGGGGGGGGASASAIALRIAGLIAVAALVVQARLEAPALDGFSLVLRAVGLAGLVVIAASAARIAEELDGLAIAAVAVAIAVLALCHAQIELNAWHAGACAAVLALLACGTRLARGGPSKAIGVAACAVPLLAASLPAISFARERALDRELERAAAIVRPLAEVREAYNELAAALAAGGTTDAGRLIKAVRETEAPDASLRADAVVAALRADKPDLVVAELVSLDGALRRSAASVLVEAAERYPASRFATEAAIKQLANSGRRTTGARSAEIKDRDAFARASALAARYAERSPGQRAYSLASDLAMEDLRAALVARDADAIAARVAAATRWARLASDAQPASARRRIDLADALAASGDNQGAVAAYEEALAQDERYSLDPLAQLSTRERNAARSALERARAAGGSGAQPAAR